MVLGACLLMALSGGIMTGCTTTGLYGKSSRHLNDATQAFLSRDWVRARQGFTTLAVQTPNPKAVTAGVYGLACVDMATAADIPSFVKGLSTLSQGPEGMGRFRNQNPELFFLGADHGIRLMEKKQRELSDQLHQQSDRLLRLDQGEKRSARKIRALEQTIKRLKHQIQVLERIDRELQEKRNPL